jgi:murein DD-endopeptidase MepM/ murein hydrolase activator NlpD
MLGVMGGAVAAGGLVTTHEAQAAGHHEGRGTDDITPIASIGHAISDGQSERPSAAAPKLLPAQSARGDGGQGELGDLNKSLRIGEQRAEAAAEAVRQREAAEREAQRDRVVWPVEGRITSKSGARWGAMHYGLDIANGIGTPIRAVKRGTMIDAGPASGFGL